MKAEYVSHMGSDLTVVNAARVSFDKESGWDLTGFVPELKQADVKLINYLSSHNHWTPFSHCMITLRETVPIFVARQRFKHMVGFTYNEVSRRYVDDGVVCWVPEEFREKVENKKQGSGGKHPFSSSWVKVCQKKVDEDIEFYETMIRGGVCPEQARAYLPLALYTSYYVTGSLAAFARAYNLRTDPHAQLEIQELAKMWGDVIEPLYPVSWKALANEKTVDSR